MQRLKTVLLKVLVYARDIILADLGLSLLVSVSFLFTRNFSFTALSERVFWVGLGITVIAGMVGFGAMFAGRSFGIPSIIRRPAEAKRLIDNLSDYRAEVDKRNDLSFRIFLIGLGCIAVSALVQTFLA